MAKTNLIVAAQETLSRIKYPGYDIDIVSLGIVEEIKETEEGTLELILRQATAHDDLMREIAQIVHDELARSSGVAAVEVRARRIEAELGGKTGKIELEGVRRIIAVASGKGGVGKSTVAANLAGALKLLGYAVGLLDADIYGPSIPMMFGAEDMRPKTAGGQIFHPVEKYGIKLVSIGFFLGERAPVIWRGPMVMGAIRQFLKDAMWGSQDFLVVDLPPGTGDAQLTLAQQVYLDGAIIVTTPQDVAVIDAQRAIRMFRQVHCPLLGIVENMSYFECPDCGEHEELFGRGGAQRMAAQEGLEVLGRLPLMTEVRESGDQGMPIVLAQPEHPASQVFTQLAKSISTLEQD